MKTGVHWLDDIVEQANLPQRVNRDTAAVIYGKLIGKPVSKHTFRRLPIPYIIHGRDASYMVDAIVTEVRRRIAEAPVRCPPQRRRSRPARGAMSLPQNATP
jgi:hypothetical protein